MSETLSITVTKEIQRLGGTIANEPQPLDLDGIPAPEPIRQFLADVTWPAGITYDDRHAHNPERGNVVLGDVRLFAEQDFEEIGMDLDYLEEDGMNMCPWADKFNDIMVQIGLTDNGKYLLMLDLEDDDPTDPQVYRLDHNDPDQFFDDLQGESLSTFLKRLVPAS
jgi:hypothetical protein